VTGLRDTDALALLDSVTHAPLDRGIRDRVVAETRAIRSLCSNCHAG
jgi:hypothetical protein